MIFSFPTSIKELFLKALQSDKKLQAFHWNKKLGRTLLEDSPFVLPDGLKANIVLSDFTKYVVPYDLKMMYRLVRSTPIGEAPVFQKCSIRLRDEKERCYYLHLYLVICRKSEDDCNIYGLIENINDNVQKKFRLERDALTGVYNRETFIQKARSLIATQPLARGFNHLLIICDADNFKSINDRLGHLVGDHVLKEMAERLTSGFCRRAIIGRFGGDEFMVFLPNVRNNASLLEKLNLVLNSFRTTYSDASICVCFSVSMGIALYPEHGKDFATLFGCADKALYYSKNFSKSNLTFYREDLPLIRPFFYSSSETDTEQGELFRNHLPEYIFQVLNQTNDFDYIINNMLYMFTNMTKARRAMLLIYDCEKDDFRLAFAHATDSAEERRLQKYLPFAVNVIRERFIDTQKFGYISACDDVDTLPPEQKEVMEKINVKSYLYNLITAQGHVLGAIGIDSCEAAHAWVTEELGKLHNFALCMTYLLTQKRAFPCLKREKRDTLEQFFHFNI